MTIYAHQEHLLHVPVPGSYLRGSSNAGAIGRRLMRRIPNTNRRELAQAGTVTLPSTGGAMAIILTIGTYDLTIEDATGNGGEYFIYVAFGTSGTVTVKDVSASTITTLSAIGQYVHLYDDAGTWTIIDPLPDDGEILVSLEDLREVDANTDVGNLAAVGGILASDSTPILRGNANEGWELSWATGNTDAVAFQVPIPRDLDDASNVTVELWVSSGTTDAATFTVDSTWAAAGADASVVSDSASDTATKSATRHKITATIAAADVPAAATSVTVSLTPAAHATNAIQLHGVRLIYARKANID